MSTKEESSSDATIDITPTTPPTTSQTKHESSIDVGIEATTLPPINSKNQVMEAADDMFNNLQQYITSEIERLFCTLLLRFHNSNILFFTGFSNSGRLQIVGNDEQFYGGKVS